MSIVQSSTFTTLLTRQGHKAQSLLYFLVFVCFYFGVLGFSFVWLFVWVFLHVCFCYISSKKQPKTPILFHKSALIGLL